MAMTVTAYSNSGRLLSSGRGRSAGLGPNAVRITRRGRLVMTLAAAGGLAAAILLAGSLIAPAPATASTSVRTTALVVQPGQTLWTIARALPGHGDVREKVDQIQALNPGLHGSLAAGSQIRLPLP